MVNIIFNVCYENVFIYGEWRSYGIFVKYIYTEICIYVYIDLLINIPLMFSSYFEIYLLVA